MQSEYRDTHIRRTKGGALKDVLDKALSLKVTGKTPLQSLIKRNTEEFLNEFMKFNTHELSADIIRKEELISKWTIYLNTWRNEKFKRTTSDIRRIEIFANMIEKLIKVIKHWDDAIFIKNITTDTGIILSEVPIISELQISETTEDSEIISDELIRKRNQSMIQFKITGRYTNNGLFAIETDNRSNFSGDLSTSISLYTFNIDDDYIYIFNPIEKKFFRIRYKTVRIIK